jgi:hypothetical protein
MFSIRIKWGPKRANTEYISQTQTSAGILEQSMGRGLGTRRNRAAVPARQATQAGGIDFLESIPGLLKSFKISSLSHQTTIMSGKKLPRLLNHQKLRSSA